MAYAEAAGEVLAAQPWVFTQCAPLDTGDVIQEAQRRGVALNAPTLRALYRWGDFQPLLEVRGRPARTPDRQNRDEPEARATVLAELRRARWEGRLVDPAVLPYRPGLQFGERSSGSPRWWNGLVYSRWQLLALPHLALRLTQARLSGPTGARWVKLPAQRPEDAETAARLRRLALALTGLESRYLPTLDPEWVELTNADRDHWERYREQVPAQQLSEQLRYPGEQARADAEWLLSAARRLDPMGDWSRLVQRAPRRKWESLTGDALTAMEHRAAAEILLCFVDDLAAAGHAEPVPHPGGLGWHPLNDRLSHQPGQLSEVLQDLGVSPHPRVVLALEGDSEAHLAPLVFGALERRLTPDLIQIVNMGGVNTKLTLLTAFAVAPLVAARRGDRYDLARPLTRLIVAVDPDKHWRTTAEVDAQRAAIMKTIREVLAAQKASVAEDDLEQLVHIHTWTDGCFEYTHFSDAELAQGLRRIHRDCGGLTDARLEHALNQQRKAGRDIEKTWSNWRPTPNKMDLAKDLWPVLEERIVAAARGEGKAPPIAHVVEKAYLLAQEHRHGRVVLRAAPSDHPEDHRW